MQFLSKFAVFDAAEFDERADIIPVFLIRLTIRLAHTGQLVSDLLGNIFRNLLNKSIILKCTSGNIQRQIRTINHTLQKKQEFRNYLFDVVRDKYLVVI